MLKYKERIIMKDLSKIDQKTGVQTPRRKYESAFELLSKAKPDQEFYDKGKNEVDIKWPDIV